MPVAKDLTAVIDRLERDIDTGALAIPDHAKEFYPEWKQRRLQYLQGVEA
jgi:hypothetical protein